MAELVSDEFFPVPPMLMTRFIIPVCDLHEEFSFTSVTTSW